MRLILAILIPWFLFFTIKRPIAGVICLVLQFIIVGWIPAAIWAVYALSQFKTEKKIAAAEQRMQAGGGDRAEAAAEPSEAGLAALGEQPAGDDQRGQER